MTAEVGKEYGEISSKIEIEIGSDEKRVCATQDLPNGMDQNGNAKDDGDGSYVFISENDVASDDPVECDLNGIKGGMDVKEREEENVGEKMTDNGEIADSLVKVADVECGEGHCQTVDVEESDLQQVNEGYKTDKVEVLVSQAGDQGAEKGNVNGHCQTIDVEESVLQQANEEYNTEKVEVLVSQAGDQGAEKENVNGFGSNEKAEENLDSQVSMEKSLELEVQEIHEGAKEEDMHRECDFVQVNHKSDISAPEDLQEGMDQGNPPADSDQGTKSVEFTSGEAPLEVSSGDVGVDLKMQESGQVTEVPSESDALVVPVCEAVKSSASNETDLVQVESEDIGIPVSDENNGVQAKSETVGIPVSDENNGFQLKSKSVGQVESEAVGILVSDEETAVQQESESETVKIPVCNKNGHVKIEHETVETPASDENGHAKLESEAVEIPASDENGHAKLESEAVEIPASDENGHAKLESEAVEIPTSDENGHAKLESEAVEIPTFDENGHVKLESEAVEIPASDENGHVKLESEAVEIPASHENGDAQLEPKDVKIHDSDENDVVKAVINANEITPEQQNYIVECVDALSADNQESTSETTGTHDSGSQDAAEEFPSLSSAGVSKTMVKATVQQVAQSGECEIPVSVDVKDTTSDVNVEHSFTNNNSHSSLPSGSSKKVRSFLDVLKSKKAGSSILGNDAKIEAETQVSKGIKVDAVSQPAETYTIENRSMVSDPEVIPESGTLISVSLSTDSARAETEVEHSPIVNTETKMDSYNEKIGVADEVSEEINTETKIESYTMENGSTADVEVQSAIKSETNGVDLIQRIESPVATDDNSSGHNIAADSEKVPFNFLVKIPRYDDKSIREQIKHAQLDVDKKTATRDAVRAELQKAKAFRKECEEVTSAANAEERAAHGLLRAKHKEIDSLQSVINLVKTARSIDDIDYRKRNAEYRIAHVTMPLQEEKNLIREIKQLKQLHEQMVANMGPQDEIQQALDKKDEVEQNLKVLRKEADSLRDSLAKAVAAHKVAREKQSVAADKQNVWQEKYYAADEIRQKAYVHLKSLKKQAYDKSKHFYNYRDNATAAHDLASQKDKDALQNLCTNQVESFMTLWNNNDEFRKDYISSNTRSTLRRLKTYDGRALGPDEDPPVLPIIISERVSRDRTPNQQAERQISAPKVVSAVIDGEKQEQTIRSEGTKVEEKPVTTKAVIKKAVKSAPAPPTSGSASVSGRLEIKEATTEEKAAKEAEELARKAEELRKQEEAKKADQLKEQLRLEELAKSKEAIERKKRNADKAKARAALRAQKEAEEKEKERERRLRKKEKRKATGKDDTSLANKEETAPTTETQTEIPEKAEVKERAMPLAKKSHKALHFVKPNKSKPIPLPLRNRGKRRMQEWMWAVLVVLVVLALFMLGNSSFSLQIPRF